MKSEGSLSNLSCKKTARVLKIGTCGFGLAKEAYARAFECVEIQHTFYQPPQIKTLERWRKEMPADFEFTLKAWQFRRPLHSSSVILNVEFQSHYKRWKRRPHASGFCISATVSFQK